MMTSNICNGTINPVKSLSFSSHIYYLIFNRGERQDIVVLKGSEFTSGNCNKFTSWPEEGAMQPFWLARSVFQLKLKCNSYFGNLLLCH